MSTTLLAPTEKDLEKLLELHGKMKTGCTQAETGEFFAMLSKHLTWLIEQGMEMVKPRFVGV